VTAESLHPENLDPLRVETYLSLWLLCRVQKLVLLCRDGPGGFSNRLDG
jgi:hypothetical protein